MTIEQTIQSLYQDISLIKEKICERAQELDSGEGVEILVSRILEVPLKAKYILIESFSEIPLTRKISPDNNFDEFGYYGFGSICFFKIINTDRYVFDFIKLDAKKKIIEVPSQSKGAYINLNIKCKVTIKYLLPRVQSPPNLP